MTLSAFFQISFPPAHFAAWRRQQIRQLSGMAVFLKNLRPNQRQMFVYS